MKIEGWDLNFFNSGEWQVIEERLGDAKRNGTLINPSRNMLFAALSAVPFDDVKAVVMGQDPYPNPDYATGIAFSVPPKVAIPVTLDEMFKEYVNDLKYPYPASGDLRRWCSEGVLLWNATPTCEAWRSASHRSWTEWTYLTQEIVEKLTKRGVAFSFLGGQAQAYAKYVDTSNGLNTVLKYAHPSPRNNSKVTKYPFAGSRFFSTLNDRITEVGHSAVDWRLP